MCFLTYKIGKEETLVPTISIFYGIIILMHLTRENTRHLTFMLSMAITKPFLLLKMAAFYMVSSLRKGRRLFRSSLPCIRMSFC